MCLPLVFGLYVLKRCLFVCVGCDDVCFFLAFDFILVVCGLCVMCDVGVWL